MENLVNKRVRLRSQFSQTTLVACSDKVSVTHINLDNNKPKPENSVWIIKSKHPEKSIRLESVYGKLLGLKVEMGLTVSQVDRPPPHDKASVERSCNWWILEDVNQSGFTSVRVRLRLSTDRHSPCLHPYGTSLVHIGSRKESSWWNSWFWEPLYIWDLEIVEDPINVQSRVISNSEDPINDQSRVTGNSEDNPLIIPSVPEGMPPSASYTYQVERMYVYQEGMAGKSFPFPNYANSGRNVNKSGTQIVGGVNVQTHIDNLVNKKIVKRTS